LYQHKYTVLDGNVQAAKTSVSKRREKSWHSVNTPIHYVKTADWKISKRWFFRPPDTTS
jgi:hypothetical protein